MPLLTDKQIEKLKEIKTAISTSYLALEEIANEVKDVDINEDDDDADDQNDAKDELEMGLNDAVSDLNKVEDNINDMIPKEKR